MTSSSNSSDQKLSRGALIALVVGSTIGSGIFALPSSFGRAAGDLGALIAWGIAGVGMLMHAFVFQTLSRRKPYLDAGIYAHTKVGRALSDPARHQGSRNAQYNRLRQDGADTALHRRPAAISLRGQGKPLHLQQG
jgi:hypothetical protein